MRKWRRVNRVPNETDRLQVTEVTEDLKARYVTVWGDGNIEEWATHDLSGRWESIDQFLKARPGFKEVHENDLSGLFEGESGDSKTERVQSGPGQAVADSEAPSEGRCCLGVKRR